MKKTILTLVILLLLLSSPAWAEIVTYSWVTPTLNADETPMDDLAGFNVIWIWMGRDENNEIIYTGGVIPINDPEATEVDLNLNGFVYLWVVGRDYKGNVANLSEVVYGYYQ